MLISQEAAVAWIDKALSLPAARFSDLDRTYLLDGLIDDPARACRLRIQFGRNIMAIPERIELQRWLFAGQAREQ